MLDSDTFRITPVDGRIHFLPGERIDLEVAWQLATAPHSAEVRLLWFTRGKGDSDQAVVQRVSLEAPGAAETRPCQLKLPDSPYSFSGKLISLIWAIELALGSGESQRLEIVVGPQMTEILLGEVPNT